VYGDLPNDLPLTHTGSRLELPAEHRYFRGIDTSMSIDASTHSLFGVSKASADLLVQEYGRYFGMPTVCFRGGCLTGPNHAGARLHGFLSYLMRCTVTGERYTVYGYEGKQVRDNIHSADLVDAFQAFHRAPVPAAVYNIGGGRSSNCSMLEAIELCETIAGRELQWDLSDENRIGDHRWWISDLDPFRRDYPDWDITYGVEDVLRQIFEHNADLWMASR
jgi:CDP-paratose 2-epimerase